jgi:hypothetical protein
MGNLAIGCLFLLLNKNIWSEITPTGVIIDERMI